MCASCRCNLAGVMLQLMALGIPDVMNFDFMSKPSAGKMALIMIVFLVHPGGVVIFLWLVDHRGRPVRCGTFGAAGSCGEERRAGSPHRSGEEDG